MDNLEMKINSINKNNLGDDIINDLQQIINYINKNILMRQKENDDEINLDEEDAQNKEIEFSENKKETKIKKKKKKKGKNIKKKKKKEKKKKKKERRIIHQKKIKKN